MRIPHIIHQIWVGDQECPFEDYIGGWQKHHNEWIHHLWREIPEEFEYTKKHLDSCTSFAQISDIFRLELLYHYGGLYVDTDFECFKNFEPLISNYEILMCREPPTNTFFNGLIASVPGHPFLKQCLENIDPSAGHIIESTGPGYITSQAVGYNIELIPRELILPYMYYEPKPSEYPADTYAAHHWALSWSK